MYINICIYTHSSFLIHHSAFTIRHQYWSFIIRHSCMCACMQRNTQVFLCYIFMKNWSNMVSRAALDGSQDRQDWSFYDVFWPICKKGMHFVREWRTSLSPLSNEMQAFFDNWRMYRTVCKVLTWYTENQTLAVFKLRESTRMKTSFLGYFGPHFGVQNASKTK